MVSQQGFAPYANGNFPASPDDNQAVNRKNYWNFQNAPDEYSPADSSNNYVTQNGKNLTDPQPHIVHPVNSSSSELPRGLEKSLVKKKSSAYLCNSRTSYAKVESLN